MHWSLAVQQIWCPPGCWSTESLLEVGYCGGRPLVFSPPLDATHVGRVSTNPPAPCKAVRQSRLPEGFQTKLFGDLRPGSDFCRGKAHTPPAFGELQNQCLDGNGHSGAPCNMLRGSVCEHSPPWHLWPACLQCSVCDPCGLFRLLHLRVALFPFHSWTTEWHAALLETWLKAPES